MPEELPEDAPRPLVATCGRPTAASPARTCSRATTTRSSTRRRSSSCSTSATCRSSSGCWRENLFWAICAEDPAAGARDWTHVPEELEGLEKALSRHLLLQLLHVPVAARRLGRRPAVPDHAHPPAQRGADPARGPRRHHLRLRRQDRPVHRPARRQARARAAPAQRRATTTSASSWSAPTRRSSATCTTSSATPTPSTSRWATRAGTTSRTWSPATRSARCCSTCNYTATTCSAALRSNVEQALREEAHHDRGVAPHPPPLRGGPGRLHLPRERLTALAPGVDRFHGARARLGAGPRRQTAP